MVPPLPVVTFANVMLSVDICHWNDDAPVAVTLKFTPVVPLVRQIVRDDGCDVIDGDAFTVTFVLVLTEQLPSVIVTPIVDVPAEPAV